MHLDHSNLLTLRLLRNEHFFSKNIKSLKELSPDSTDVMCKLEIDKYIERPRVIPNISLIEYVADYNKKKRRKKSHVVRYVHYNHYWHPKSNYGEQLLIFFHLLKVKNLSRNTTKRGMMHTLHMKKTF